MADTKLLSILHISDFHFTSRKKREQGIIVDALVDDLSMLCVGHRKPDLIIFTGDMVQAGGVDSHDDAYDFVLDRVSKATGCSDERIYIVPGNHDLSRAAVTEFADNHRYWRSALGGPNELAELNALYEKGEFDEPIKAKFRAFADLDGYLRGGDRRGTLKLRNGFATVDHIDPLNIDLVVINTAALSTGGQSGFDRDERLLAVPEYAIIEIIKVLKEGSLKIFATHHPFGMLSEQSARYLERAIEKHADVHLFGHMHDPHPKKTVGLAGEILADQAGALFTARRDAYNGYSLLTLDRSTGAAEMFVRSYYKDRSEFDEGTPAAVKGLLSKLKDKHYLLWAFILHLNELRRLRGLNDSHAIQLEEPIAGAVANLKGGSRETRQSEKTRQLARFRRDRLMLTVKPDK